MRIMSILRLVDDDKQMDVFVADFLSHKNRDRMGTNASYSYPHPHSSTIVHSFVFIWIITYNRSHLERLGLQESSTESNVRDPGKEKDRNEDKVMVEDRTPSSSPTVDDSNLKLTNASKVKKSFNMKTKGQKAKAADITQYFKTDHRWTKLTLHILCWFVLLWRFYYCRCNCLLVTRNWNMSGFQ